MKRAALAVALVSALSGTASAGTYIGLGIGPAPTVSTTSTPDAENAVLGHGRSGRLILGQRFGRFAIEGALGKFDLELADNGGQGPIYTVYQAQVAGRYGLPLGDGFEVFGKLGLQKQWFNNERSEFDVSGSGLLLGAGAEYRIPTGAAVSIFIDYQYSRGDVNGDRLKFGETSTRLWTLGATIGF